MSSPDAPRRRRRAKSNELVTIYWRDIPAQVTATANGEKGSWLLEERFQLAIDKAADIAELTDADDYILQWRKVSQPLSGDPQDAAQAEAERLQELYPRDRIREIVVNGGLDAAAPGTEESHD